MKNQSHMQSLDLAAIAHQATIDAGFVPDVPQSVLAELQALESKPPPAVDGSSTRDLRSLLWSSIDDQKSRALDQVECAERLANGDIRVQVGIADVDALVCCAVCLTSISDWNRSKTPNEAFAIWSRTIHNSPGG